MNAMASSILSQLPPPRHATTSAKTTIEENNSDHLDGGDYDDDEESKSITDGTTKKQGAQSSEVRAAAARSSACPPTYESRCRAAVEASKLSREERQRRGVKLFVPRSLQDFGDGGSFPEIHVAQYPLQMGNPHVRKAGGGGGAGSSAIVNVTVDKDGQVSYDAIVKSGTNRDKIVYSRHEDMRGADISGDGVDPDDLALPTPEEEEAEAARTQAALQLLLQSKTAGDKPSGSALANVEASRNLESKTTYINYAANPNAPGYNPSASRRVIQMVPAQVDPMMPPKHRHLKAPRGPAEDPVPVLHAPPAKLTKEERAAWNIPACISNWKNSRGFTIPLDKRLAADGRGLRDHTISSNFATLSESLYVAERQARQEVRLRAQVQKKMLLQEKEQREQELRELAQQARMERGGGSGGMRMGSVGLAAAPSTAARPGNGGGGGGALSALQDDASSSEEESSQGERKVPPPQDSEDAVAARQRERLRLERKRERERELRMDRNMELKKKRLEEERDVSEKIALGVHTGSGGLGADVDSRLYSQTGGLDSGFGAEDEYNTYSKPLFDRQGVTSSSIYRPTRGETDYNADEQYDKLVQGATSKFQPDKGFAGAEGGGMAGGSRGAGPRAAPVQFERGSDK
jgi:SNW domain-containing protein 1